MKRLVVALGIILGLSTSMALANASPAFAATPLTDACKGAGASSSICTSQNTDLSKDPITGANGVLTKTISVVSYIAGITAVIVMMVGGIMYVTSSGESGKTNTAREMIIYSLVGLVIIVLARSIVVFIINRV
jgi:hypothetical protein